MEWHHPTSPRLKKSKSQQSAEKVMVTVFWDSVGVILVDFMSKETTSNLDVHIDTLKKLKARVQRVQTALVFSKVLFQQDKPASKPVRLSARLAGQQFHIPHICPTSHHLTSICLGASKKV